MTSRPAEHSPLAGMTDELAAACAATNGAVQAAEVPGLAQVALRLNPGQRRVIQALERRLGATLPTEPNTWTAGLVELLWLGPDEWLVVGSRGGQAPLLGALERAFAYGGATAESGATAVDVSDQRTVVDVSGPAAAALLAGGCSLDLDPRRFPLGSCVQTQLAGVNVLILARPGQSAFRIVVRSSLATHVGGWLLGAIAGVAGLP